MRFDIITLFPEMVQSCFAEGVVGRALQRGDIALKCVNPRDFTSDVHRTVDDTLYGGGSGMLMKAEPLASAVSAVERTSRSRVIYLSPQGQPLNQAKVRELAELEQLILVCGRYEGVDQRFIDHYVDEEISIGDYVISGGELAASVVIDSVARCIPGVIAQVQSVTEDSFFEGLLDAPHYTRPAEFEAEAVPAVLSGGHHEHIEQWREEQSLRRTWHKRPDLLEKTVLSTRQRTMLREIMREDWQQRGMPGANVSIALIHYPVYNKRHEVITTSVTNMDLHDISRTVRTFELTNYFVVTPVKSQHELMGRITRHWTEGYGSTYNPDRKEAFDRMQFVHSLEDVREHFRKRGQRLVITATSANPKWTNTTYPHLSRMMDQDRETQHLILFGTGWGLTDEIMEAADYVLPPIDGNGEYNHLSVRSAAAITLDRVFRRYP
ncbi:tRNA (guanosine(37)-N1)-methyltransferase TrmD [Desulfurispirillum indicum]|uniref:tRNA (guanosine(37)-N1)-methyltransferase TrmD n=1 Tax=Desulfurispirillum indicum TaxID=936456 RepID=UPI001CF9560E|nr:tRNA (guanosine(37)-N1)-methyltransferase TrmD [Desulfurispirillum indicum]UCZ56653.1 tRNA (guanosine(37)-N1)-methyltransferase TrmD [Desulfurispirillum indicum]